MLSVRELEEQTRELAASLDLSEEVTDAAAGYATRAYAEHPVNRAPSTLAAASVYLAAFTRNEKRTQEEVADAADTSRTSIRAAYPEIAEHEDIRLAKGNPGPRGPGLPTRSFKRAREFLPGGDA